ncbi:endonuclease domain-containing protein [Microbacterium sp. ASV81]|uniref:endonuclease domain-containing protein n=1 Tax=Microbacterium capsulatum TaxID=3041921 RepID=UPI002805E9D8|nr:DUF559 domain-containing protein [Microbacterium sp. ASV81]
MQTDPIDLTEIADPYERQRQARIARAADYAPRLHSGHFFSHHTAASIWGAPLPLVVDEHGRPAHDADLALHVCALGSVPLPRAGGVTRHRTLLSMTATTTYNGFRVSSPAATWASLGELRVVDIVALGDYFCRQWKPGAGRRDVGRPPLATIEELEELMEAGRRRGIAKLREAIGLIRVDSWSPRESHLRWLLVDSGLPEPELNADVFDEHGAFLGCVDLVYPAQKVAIEYHGLQHSSQWARDVERANALRAAGWTVIEVTASLLNDPTELLRRIRAALAR